MSSTNRKHPGIETRPDSKGVTRYRGIASDKATRKLIRGPWTASLAAAKSWRRDAMSAIEKGTLSADRGMKLADAIEQFLAGAEPGHVRNRRGASYKPSALRGYRYHLRSRVSTEFGDRHLNDITTGDVQRFVNGVLAEGKSASTVRNAVTALRAVYAWAVPLGHARANPVTGVKLPTGGEARDRIATPTEARQLIAAMPAKYQAALGLAFYAGLRLGEFIGLSREHIDLDRLTLTVARAWDVNGREWVLPKSKAGTRRVPINGRLETLLRDHLVLTNQSEGLLFPWDRDPTRPLESNVLRRRLVKACEKTGIEPIGFHEARHTFASISIAAGVNAKALSSYMGHKNITLTFDLYGHLMPGNEAEARDLIDAYLTRADNT